MKKIIILQPSKFLDIRQDKLIKSFVEKNFRVHIIYFQCNESFVTDKLYEEITKKINFYYVKSNIPLNIPYNPIRNIKVRRIINQINPDILICRDIMISGFIDKYHKYNSFLDVCDNFPEVVEILLNKPFNIIGKVISNFYEKNALKKFKNIIFVSDSAASYILNKHKINNKKYFILENVPLKKEIDLPVVKNKKDFVYIGTINKKIRDIDTVIDAIQYCSKKENIKITFDIYYFKRQIEIINYYKEIVREKGLQELINFYEAVSVEELPLILNNYKCGLVPHCRNKATDFTIPNKLYDYLQLGMNVITSDNPSMKRFSDNLNVTEYYEGENYHSLAQLMVGVYKKNNNSENVKAKLLINEQLNWEICFNRFYEWAVK